jgi:uncharacterized membrane protein YkoI
MTQAFSTALLVLVLNGWPIAMAIDLARAGEKDVLELEDISDDEKVRWARATRVSVTDAIRTATAKRPGQVIEAALHSIKGRLLYEIEVVTNDGKIVELYVDPQTGILIDLGAKR